MYTIVKVSKSSIWSNKATLYLNECCMLMMIQYTYFNFLLDNGFRANVATIKPLNYSYPLIFAILSMGLKL